MDCPTDETKAKRWGEKLHINKIVLSIYWWVEPFHLTRDNVHFTFKTHSTLRHSYIYCGRSAQNHEQYVIKKVEAGLV